MKIKITEENEKNRFRFPAGRPVYPNFEIHETFLSILSLWKKMKRMICIREKIKWYALGQIG